MRLPLAVLASLILPAAAFAGAPADKPAVTLVLQDHRFTPSAVTVPAGQKVEIILINKDAAYEEFDSDELMTEQDVTPHGTVRFEIGPLKPGTYHFMGEHHPSTAQGVVTAE
jgi:hypothetical protein